MILVDANLLLYAHIREYSRHEAAANWLEERALAVRAVPKPRVAAAGGRHARRND